ncbi:tetratricopeptide repeat protein [bacterium]|nr:tetratricopeptide repeat protein [bacterium]
MSFKYSNDKNNSFNKARFTSNPVKKDKNFFCSLGDNFMLKNEYRKAVKEYLVSLMIDKNNIPACKGASKAYKNLKEYDKAIKHLKNARNIYGFDSEIYYELGLNYLLNADNENAQKNFIRTIKLEPDNKNAQIKLALTHELSGEEDMAILVYDTIIERYPHYIPAMASLASLYIEKEEYKKAINLYKQIVKINKEYYRAFLGLGLCFDKLGKYIIAVRYYKKYIAKKPNSQTAKSLAGRIYEIYKNKEKNNSQFLKVIKNSPTKIG